MDYKKRFISSVSPDSLVTIIPDGATKEISVSKAILCDTSEYFVKALNGDFRESREGLRFPGFSVEIVELFLFWAHKHHLPNFEDHVMESDEDQTDAARDEAQIALINLWVFADAYLIRKLQNEAMKQLVALTVEWFTDAPVVRHGYGTAPKGSALSRFIMDEARYMYFSNSAGCGFEEQDLENMAQIPGFLPDFLGPVRQRLLHEGKEVVSETYPAAHIIGPDVYMVKED